MFERAPQTRLTRRDIGTAAKNHDDTSETGTTRNMKLQASSTRDFDNMKNSSDINTG